MNIAQKSALLSFICLSCKNVQELELAIANKIQKEGAGIINNILKFLAIDYQKGLFSLAKTAHILESFLDENGIIPGILPSSLQFPYKYALLWRNINLTAADSAQYIQPETRDVVISLLANRGINNPLREGNVVATYIRKFSVDDLLHLKNGWQLITAPETFLYLSEDGQKDVFLALIINQPVEEEDVISENLRRNNFSSNAVYYAVREAIEGGDLDDNILNFFALFELSGTISSGILDAMQLFYNHLLNQGYDPSELIQLRFWLGDEDLPYEVADI